MIKWIKNVYNRIVNKSVLPSNVTITDNLTPKMGFNLSLGFDIEPTSAKNLKVRVNSFVFNGPGEISTQFIESSDVKVLQGLMSTLSLAFSEYITNAQLTNDIKSVEYTNSSVNPNMNTNKLLN